MPQNGQIEVIAERMARIGRPVRLMEVCGTHTVAAFRCGLRSLLPDALSLISGPGCPVCVTPTSYIDHAVAIAAQPGVIITTFGDMIRVPGTHGSLERERANGADIRIVYSPADALKLARKSPEKTVVFLGVGFETTIPAVGWTLLQAQREHVTNYAVLCAHKVMPPAMAALVADGDIQVDGFLCPGHVSAIIGAEAYGFLAKDHHIPCVVAGFEPQDLIRAVDMLLQQVENARAEVQIQYTRAVSRTPNPKAMQLIRSVFEPADTAWRGLGTIPGSGLRIRPEFSRLDAETAFGTMPALDEASSSGCRCGEILKGTCAPPDCPLFDNGCTPATPVGACMVSSEGTCAAFYTFTARSAHEPPCADKHNRNADSSC